MVGRCDLTSEKAKKFASLAITFFALMSLVALKFSFKSSTFLIYSFQLLYIHDNQFAKALQLGVVMVLFCVTHDTVDISFRRRANNNRRLLEKDLA